MSKEQSKDKKELPAWTKPKVNLVGVNLNELSPEQLQKLVALMEEIDYEPIQFTHSAATPD